MTERPSFLRIDSALRRFGPVVAVDRVDLDIGAGEFFALLGPSGCGKSTLMRAVAGLERLDAGRVLLDGEDITAVPPHRRPINMMFQSYALFPHLSVRGNVAFGPKRLGLSGAELARRVDAMLALTRLEALADRKPDQLSGGQRQRVALARALARQPKLLLLDEPLGALDKKLRGEMQEELKRIQHDTRTTFVVVTHDQEEALALADRMAIMRAGRIVALGAPAELYERPPDAFTAAFLGEVNLVPATPAGDGLWRVQGVSAPVLVEAAPSARGAEGLSLAVRPERLRLSAAPPNGAALAWRGRVARRTLKGATVALGLKVADGPALTAEVPSPDPMARLAVGDAAHVSCDPGDLRIVGPGGVP